MLFSIIKHINIGRGICAKYKLETNFPHQYLLSKSYCLLTGIFHNTPPKHDISVQNILEIHPWEIAFK